MRSYIHHITVSKEIESISTYAVGKNMGPIGDTILVPEVAFLVWYLLWRQVPWEVRNTPKNIAKTLQGISDISFE